MNTIPTADVMKVEANETVNKYTSKQLFDYWLNNVYKIE
jgi:hypothetical protein